MEDVIVNACQFLDMKHNLQSFNFKDNITSQYKMAIPHYTRGVYIIFDKTVSQTVYIGKGQVVDRIIQHRKKVKNTIDKWHGNYASWANYLDNYEKDVDSWKVYYVKCNSESEMSALEGILIHRLKPVANDEIFLDTQFAQHMKSRGGTLYEYGVHYSNRNYWR